jgi:hypothetical protein
VPSVHDRLRLTTQFRFASKGALRRGGSLEFHGDLGRVYLGNFQRFDAGVEYGEYEAVPHLKTPFQGIQLARAAEERAVEISSEFEPPTPMDWAR